MSGDKNYLNRRTFLKGTGLGLIGLSAFRRKISLLPDLPDGFLSPRIESGQLFKKVTAPARVSLMKGNDRREIVYNSLKIIENEVLGSIGNKKILIKPNVVLSDNPLSVTHVDAVRAILDFLTPHYKKQIIIGESAAHNTIKGFKNAGYYELKKEYNVKLIDLNERPYEYRYVIGKDNQPLAIRIISTFFDPDIYLISAARMKTHNIVLVTLSLKNVLLGCPLNDYKNNDKALMHTDLNTAANDICHFNMFHIAQEVYPDLAVIDGFEAMEGKGPAWGTPFDARVAIASLDALAADTLATKVMGFDPKIVLYLSAMSEAGMGQGELGQIKVLGTPLEQCLYRFKVDEKTAKIYKL